ncbi:MAG: alpha/beta hydrolase, partial [Micrococcus sp.]|nr:alpha/beta hydrolase [Micrococcus sp.]
MGATSGLTPASFTADSIAAMHARLRADMVLRAELSRRGRSALDGIVHALKPEGMDAEYPARRLLAYDLRAAAGPTAVIAVGDPATATHVTWVVSGMGIRAHTAMWGSTREAAQLWAAQREAGAPRPCVIAWLGYAAPKFWRVLFDGPARAGAAALVADLRAWEQFARVHAEDEVPALRARGTAVHCAVEAHSYGTLVAAHTLRQLHADELTTTTPAPASASGEEALVDVLVVTGAIGLPASLAADLQVLGGSAAQVFQARAPGDYLAAVGRVAALRRAWRDTRSLPVAPTKALRGAAVSGHDTSRWRADAGEDAPRGYRDP